MNILKRFISINRRNIHSTSFLRSPHISEILSSERSLIRVQGDEVVPFLQGLITNDMTHLQASSPSIYTMFLNKSGRVLHDSIIYKTSESDTFIIETDKNGSSELRRHLRLFRVRRKIDIDELDNDYKLWVLFQNETTSPALSETKMSSIKDEFIHSEKINSKEIIICSDPRTKSLGIRLIMPTSLEKKELTEIFPSANITSSTPKNDYKLHRYKLGVSEGMSEHFHNKILPFETNIDYLHGISFHKGCYIGQELTARTYHTGVIRKRIMPIELKKPIAEGVEEVRTASGSVCGTIRGAKDNYCIAVLRTDKVMQSECLYIGEDPCKLIIPNWWPKELPNKMKLKDKQ